MWGTVTAQVPLPGLAAFHNPHTWCIASLACGFSVR
jgi:hypothetical protein